MTKRTWVGGSGDWSNAADWSPQGVPGSSDTVVLGAGADVVIASGETEAAVYVVLTAPTASLTVNGVLVGASLVFNGGQLKGSGVVENATFIDPLTTSALTVEQLLGLGAAPGRPGLVVTAPGGTVTGVGQTTPTDNIVATLTGSIVLTGSADPTRPVVFQGNGGQFELATQVDVTGAVVFKSGSGGGTVYASDIVNVAPGGDLVVQNSTLAAVRIVSGTLDASAASSPVANVTFDDAAGKLVLADAGPTAVTGFRAGDTIDVKNAGVLGPLVPSSSGVLTVGGATIQLQGPTKPGATYTAAADGSGGTLVTTTAQPAATVAFADQTTGATGSHALATASGGPSYLQWQYVEPQLIGDADQVAMTATVPNVFLKGGGGPEALAVTSGRNVLDGGSGSAFLSGGSGTDTFFVDLGNSPSWDTLTNFHAGDALTLWNWSSSYTDSVDPLAGAAGHQGATLNFTAPGGGVTNKVTIAGLSADQAAHLQTATGTLSGRSYLYLYNPGV